MVCYKILIGKVPFSTTYSPKEVKKVVLSGERPILPSECPVTLDTLICSCWEPEASLRPSFVKICNTLKCLRSILLTGHEIGEEGKMSENIFTNIIRTSLEPSMSEHIDASENISDRVALDDARSWLLLNCLSARVDPQRLKESANARVFTATK